MDQESGQDQSTDQSPPAGDTESQSAQAADAQKLLADAQAQIAALRQENAKHRKAKQAERERASEALEKNGEFKALAAERAQTIAELQSKLQELEPAAKKAAQFDQLIEQRKNAVAERLEQLPENLRGIVAKIPDVFDQEQAIAELSQQTQAEPKKPPPKTVNAAAGQSSDDELRGIGERDPAAWEQIKAQLGIPTKRKPSLKI